MSFILFSCTRSHKNVVSPNRLGTWWFLICQCWCHHLDGEGMLTCFIFTVFPRLSCFNFIFFSWIYSKFRNINIVFWLLLLDAWSCFQFSCQVKCLKWYNRWRDEYLIIKAGIPIQFQLIEINISACFKALPLHFCNLHWKGN